MNDLVNKAKKIKCLVCDVDGVLTDGLLYLDALGHELKTFHVMDGVGLRMLMFAGIQVAIITGSTTPVIDYRMQQLNIEYYFKGYVNKQKAFDVLQSRLNLNHDEFAYIGDDVPDLPLIQQVGFGIAVANAVAEVKRHAIWHTTKPGGHGGVREVCDFILYAQDKFELAMNRYIA